MSYASVAASTPSTPPNKKSRASAADSAHQTPRANSRDRSRRKTPGSRNASQTRDESPSPSQSERAYYRSPDDPPPGVVEEYERQANERWQARQARQSRAASEPPQDAANALAMHPGGEGSLAIADPVDPPAEDEPFSGPRIPMGPRDDVATTGDRPRSLSPMSISDREEQNPFVVSAIPATLTTRMPPTQRMLPPPHGTPDIPEPSDGSRTPTQGPRLPSFEEDSQLVPALLEFRPNGHSVPDLDPQDSAAEEILQSLRVAGASINDGRLRHFVADADTYMKEFSPQFQAVVKADPTHWSYVSVHNGGRVLFSQFPQTSQYIIDHLDAGGIEVSAIQAPYRAAQMAEAAAAVNNRGRGGSRGGRGRGRGRGQGRGGAARGPTLNAGDKYGGPLAIAIRIDDPTQRRILRELGTIAFSPTVSFSVAEFGLHPQPHIDERSWAVCLIHAEKSSGNIDTLTKKLRYTIKHCLWRDHRFGEMIAKANPSPASTPMKVLDFTESFDLVYQPYTYLSARVHQPCWILYAAPTARHPDPVQRARVENAIRRYIAAPPYRYYEWDFYQAFPVVVSCTICKMDDHPTYACPLRTVDTWFGAKTSITETIQEALANPPQHAEAAQESNSGNGINA